MKMVFREGRTKAIGTIFKLHPHVSAVAQNTRQQRAQKKAMEANHTLNPAIIFVSNLNDIYVYLHSAYDSTVTAEGELTLASPIVPF
jgi:hypothetical protein